MNPRTKLLLLALTGALSGSALYALRSQPAETPIERSFERALGAAVADAQATLEKETELFEDHSSWDDPWIVESAHYEVRTTHSRALGLEVANGLETMRAYFVQLLGEGGATGRRKIFIFPDRASYNAFGEQFGEHHSSILGGFYANGHQDRPVATYVDEVRTRMQMWITHCALHQFLQGHSNSQPPVWVDEGLASYFALFWDFSYGVRELEALEQAGRLVPIEQLIGEDITAYPADPHARFIQLGMMFTYLLRYREETRRLEGEAEPTAAFDEFLKAAIAGRALEGLPFAAFLEEQGEALERAFLEFEFE